MFLEPYEAAAHASACVRERDYVCGCVCARARARACERACVHVLARFPLLNLKPVMDETPGDVYLGSQSYHVLRIHLL